jgi:hypothetical protein
MTAFIESGDSRGAYRGQLPRRARGRADAFEDAALPARLALASA